MANTALALANQKAFDFGNLVGRLKDDLSNAMHQRSQELVLERKKKEELEFHKQEEISALKEQLQSTSNKVLNRIKNDDY